MEQLMSLIHIIDNAFRLIKEALHEVEKIAYPELYKNNNEQEDNNNGNG